MTKFATRMLALSMLAGGLSLAGSAVAGQSVVYETGFDSTDVSGQSYTTSSLDGQNGWVATNAVVTNSLSQAGGQAVQLNADSSISRSVAASNEVWIIGSYRGNGSSGAPSYPAGEPAAAIIHFSADNGIQALNGDGVGGGTFQPASGGILTSDSTWTEVALHLVYNRSPKYWDALVNGVPYQKNLGFRDASINSLTGFKSLSGTPSYFDTFRVIQSDGDVDSDGSPDWYEVSQNTNPLSASSVPTLGDVNGDGRVTTLDAVIQYKISRENPQVTAGTPQDVNLDGNADALDALLIYRWAIGDARVATLPTARP